MSQPVNPIGRRERKARETRRRVLDASETLFVRDGYGATTIAAVADEADVAVQTIYAIFGNKRALLSELLSARVVNDDDPTVPLGDRDEWREMEHEPDPHHQLALLARISAQVGARVGPLYEVLAAAASVDHEIAELFRRQQQSRYLDQRRVAQQLAEAGALKSGLTVERATDVLWSVANPQMHHSLVHERGWPADEYEQWLADMLDHALLPPGGQAADGV